ncbi:HEAT repeat domain-containing protein [Methyloglobulus sp.]|uniref:HEAT repeat domain-containing protein n=1 Tax=Methyloglobulus sp. TaxID=2518622 RepID=UPI0032B7B88F
MALINQSSSTIDDALLLLEIKTPSLALPKPWAKNKGIVFFFGLWLLTGSETAIAQAETPKSFATSVNNEILNINLQGNRLSIEAKHISWKKLIKRLEEVTHILIYGYLPMKSEVSVSIPENTLMETLGQLFGPGMDFVFHYPKDGLHGFEMPKEIWVLGSFLGHGVQTMKVTSGSIPKNQRVELEEYSFDKEKEIVDALVEKARNDINPESRIEAMTSLVANQIDDTAIEQTLEAALKDKEPSVRGYAVHALANKEGEQATEHLRRTLQDIDAEVRKKAVENVVPEGQGIALLKEALTNPDQLVQDIAAERLKQITNKEELNDLPAL